MAISHVLLRPTVSALNVNSYPAEEFEGSKATFHRSPGASFINVAYAQKMIYKKQTCAVLHGHSDPCVYTHTNGRDEKLRHRWQKEEWREICENNTINIMLPLMYHTVLKPILK